jgi:regulator of replication initiation timing
MVTPKKIIIKDLELADEEIARLRKEHKKLKEDLNFYYKSAKQFREDKDVLMKENEELEEENKELKDKLDKLRTDNIYEE